MNNTAKESFIKNHTVTETPSLVSHDNAYSKFLSPINIFMGVCLIGYLYAFLFVPIEAADHQHYYQISDLWFNSHWTTDDAYQQTYPFHKVLHPELFKDDIVTQMMESYLPPLHYWLTYGFTFISKSPILAGHWVMLIQVVLTALFLFLAVNCLTGIAPALFSVIWFFHTRHIVQRLTCGLPRGWSAPLIAIFIYFLVKKNHKAVLLTLLIGTLFHPVSAFLVALCYGLYLFLGLLFSEQKNIFKKDLIRYTLFAPVILITAICVVRMPENIGSMASLEVASQMPEFSNEGGRFPFYPLTPAMREIYDFGFQAMLSRFYRVDKFVGYLVPSLIISMLLIAGLISLKRKKNYFPLELFTFGLGSMIVYFLSRIFAFRLYVPNRHLQIPMGLFFIVATTVVVWRVLYKQNPEDNNNDFSSSYISKAKYSFLGLITIALLVMLGSGTGLYGSMNFNTPVFQKGRAAEWISKNTPENSLIAGHPAIVDNIGLVGMRKVYITQETAHPFYDKYYATIKPRIEISLRAHYAKNLTELYNLVAKEGINYFVFWRKLFYPAELAEATLFKPYDQLVRELTAGPEAQYAYRELPKDISSDKLNPLVFKDKEAVVIDVKKLGEYLRINGK